jgi:hypothetical protein
MHFSLRDVTEPPMIGEIEKNFVDSRFQSRNWLKNTRALSGFLAEVHT